MTDLVVAVLMIIGTTFMVLAAVGLLRMPDIYTRVQTSTKAATLGVAGIFLAVAIYDLGTAAMTRALLAIGFVLLTTPIAGHMLVRASYFVGTPFWEGTVVDDLRGQYDLRTHELKSAGVPDPTPETKGEPSEDL